MTSYYFYSNHKLGNMQESRIWGDLVETFKLWLEERQLIVISFFQLTGCDYNLK